MNYTKISMTDIEEFFILTDDIVRILRYRKAFYDDEGNPRYFEDAREYQNALSHEDTFIVEKLIHSEKYISGGLLNGPAEDIFAENLRPLQKLILALYRKGTGGDCFYCVDETFLDNYLLKAVTLRIIDRMLYEAENKPTKKYFLTWTTDCCHDMDEWVGIACTREELRGLYEKAKAEDGEYYEASGLKLEAYEYTEEGGFEPASML